MRSVHLQHDKEVFKIAELPVERFAESLGLPGAPKINFLSREMAKKKKNAVRVVQSVPEEDADSDDGEAQVESDESGEEDGGSDNGTTEEGAGQKATEKQGVNQVRVSYLGSHKKWQLFIPTLFIL